jgi:hypothetical protein
MVQGLYELPVVYIAQAADATPITAHTEKQRVVKRTHQAPPPPSVTLFDVGFFKPQICSIC